MGRTSPNDKTKPDKKPKRERKWKHGHDKSSRRPKMKRIKARVAPVDVQDFRPSLVQKVEDLRKKLKTPWKVPPDMHPRLALLVLRGQACGCALASGNGFCAKVPLNVGLRKLRGLPPPYHCEHHQGRGAPVGNTNGMKHGFYANAILPGEEELAEKLKQDDLEQEILLWKLKLRRILVALKSQEEALSSASRKDRERAMRTEKKTSKYESELVVKRYKNGKGEPKKKLVYRMKEVERTTELSLPDLHAKANSAAAMLVKLTMAQAALHGIEDEGPLDSTKKAELARRMLQKAKEDA